MAASGEGWKKCLCDVKSGAFTRRVPCLQPPRPGRHVYRDMTPALPVTRGNGTPTRGHRDVIVTEVLHKDLPCDVGGRDSDGLWR